MSDSPWTFAGESNAAGVGGDTVTLVEGSSFCLCASNGDIETGSAHGLYFLDTRFLSRLVLRIDGQQLQPLSVAVDEPFAATFLSRLPPDPHGPEGTIAVFRRRSVGDGLVERIVLRSYSTRARSVTVHLEIDADFADLFAVKEGRVAGRTAGHRDYGGDELVFRTTDDDIERRTHARVTPAADVDHAGATWRFPLEPRGEVELCIEITGAVAGIRVDPRYSCEHPAEDSHPVREMNAWRAAAPVIDTDNAALQQALHRASEDLGSLRLVDPEHPDDVMVAAGAPWFMTLFGRDSLLTSYMALIVDPDIALGVLRTLARLQGTIENPETEEQPGRILHEIRFHDRPSRSFRDGTRYFGAADATPLFVVLLGELRRWGLARSAVDELLVHADRALEWIDRFGDRDGDGYVEYERLTPHGLANQGWKDSGDGITFADGRIPEGPIALCEVQGYVYAAYLARAFFAREQGDRALDDHYRAKAAALKDAFNRDFWLEDRGYLALALDGQKRPVDAMASNMGHCLWSGILDEDKAAQVAGHLMGPEMFSGWGVRTLGTSMAAYNPLSYHNGSVWPHDNAIIAAGLARYGFADASHRIITAMLDVTTFTGGRLPELFSGISREELSAPAVYPTSCIPQAWAAASPLLFLRTLLRFDPWMPQRMLWISPLLPESMRRLAVSRIPVDGQRVSIEVDWNDLQITGVPPDVEVFTEPRHPLTAALDP